MVFFVNYYEGQRPTTRYWFPFDYSLVITLLRTTTVQNNFMYYPLMGLHFWPCNFHQQVQDSTSGKSGNLLQDQEKSGKFDVFWKKSGKSKWRRLLSMQIFNFKKNPYACRNVCSWIVFENQLYIWCYYLHLVVRWFNIANPFYFNLSEVFFNLDQERKLHAINCVLFFAMVFISSLNSEQ